MLIRSFIRYKIQLIEKVTNKYFIKSYKEKDNALGTLYRLLWKPKNVEQGTPSRMYLIVIGSNFGFILIECNISRSKSRLQFSVSKWFFGQRNYYSIDNSIYKQFIYSFYQ